MSTETLMRTGKPCAQDSDVAYLLFSPFRVVMVT
jgi:hypothetical protein